MKPQEYTFIKEVLGEGRKPFYYYKDKYALELARLLCEKELRISEFKQSGFGFLLQKQPLKSILSGLGRSTLRREDLDGYVQTDGKYFNYTISEWGEYIPHRKDGWYQTTRPGVNLVLQLNFDDFHNYIYHQLVKPDKENHPFVYFGHPVSWQHNYTMAWARLDISLDTGEVLIEEIQNDWIREARYQTQVLERRAENGEDLSSHWIVEGTTVEALREYYEHLAKVYTPIWEEAMLCLAIHFCKEELGVERIFYHTFEGGNYLKEMGNWVPPRSIYTKLPRRFGFRETDEVPLLIKQEQYLKRRLKKPGLKWFVLNV